jgi:hypothetical protein
MTDPTPTWLATPEDVAALLRARTKDDTGRELGEWTTATRPTLADVEHLIELAAGQDTDVDGPSVACSPLCRNVIALHVACLIELSYFPEQVRSDRSPYSDLRDLLADARTAFDSCRASGSPDDPGSGAGYGFHSLNIDPETTALYYGSEPWGWRYPEQPATWQRACVAPSSSEPANIVEPEPPPEPLTDVQIGYPGEGDPERGLPPILAPDDA